MDSILREGGPHKIRHVKNDVYEFSVSVPLDADGMRGSECPDTECAPRYFKVRPGTGVIDGPGVLYCPYCRKSDTAEGFITAAQKAYAVEILKREAMAGVHRMLGSALGVDASGTRTFGGGFLTMKLSIPRPRLVSAQLPREEELRREITCKCCGLEHAVFGFAIWCPDCGADVFLLHVAAECQAVTTALAAVAGRRSELGARVAANDLDNALEDAVSIFEASLKVTLRKYLEAQGKPEHEINELFDRSVRNGFQNIGRAEELFRALTGGELLRDLSPSDVARLKLIFEKRHPITHNRGIADDKFLARTGLHGWGREVVASEAEVREVLGIVTRVIESAYRGLFPDAVSHSQ